MSQKGDVIDYRCQINTFEYYNSPWHSIYTPTTHENEEIMHKDKSDLCSIDI